jgi:hypothetical protein
MDYIQETVRHENLLLESVSKRKALEEISFKIDDSAIIDEKLIHVLCPTFRSLAICKKDISDYDLGMILKNAKNLELLQVSGWPEITFEGLAAIQEI